MEETSRKDGNINNNNEEIFFMANGRCTSAENSRRSGDGHVTPEDLQQKLQEFKHHLNIVKSLYNHSNSNNSNNGYSLENTSPLEDNNGNDTANHRSEIDTKVHHNNNEIEKWQGNSNQSQTSTDLESFNVLENTVEDSQHSQKKKASSVSTSNTTDNLSKQKKLKTSKQSKTCTMTNSKEKSNTKIPHKTFTLTKNPSRTNQNPQKESQTAKGNKQTHVNNNLPHQHQGARKGPSPFGAKNTAGRNHEPGTVKHTIKGVSGKSKGSTLNGYDSDQSKSSNSPLNTANTKMQCIPDSSKKLVRKRNSSAARRSTARSSSSVSVAALENEKPAANLQSAYNRKVKELQEETTLQELSYNLKEKHFETMRGELQARCEQYQTHIYDLEQRSRDHNTRTGELEISYHKLHWEHTKMSEQYEQLQKTKQSVENELHHCQQRLNKSCCVQKEVEKCLEKSQENENSLRSRLERVELENETLKKDLEAMNSLCFESDKQLEYYQNMATDLQCCMDKAILQITHLEQQSAEKSLQHKMAYEKLAGEYENLRREHEAVKMLYREALRRIEDSVKMNSELRRSFQMRSLTSSIEMLNIASSDEMFNSTTRSRNQSPFATPNYSPRIQKKQSLRRTWFSQDIPLTQFQPADDSLSEGGYFNTLNTSNRNVSSVSGHRIPTRRSHYNHHHHNNHQRRRDFYDYNTDPAESDTDSTISSRSAASVKSCTIKIERRMSKRWRAAPNQSSLLLPNQQCLDSEDKEIEKHSSTMSRDEKSAHAYNLSRDEPSLADNQPKQRRPQSWYVPFSAIKSQNKKSDDAETASCILQAQHQKRLRQKSLSSSHGNIARVIETNDKLNKRSIPLSRKKTFLLKKNQQLAAISATSKSKTPTDATKTSTKQPTKNISSIISMNRRSTTRIPSKASKSNTPSMTSLIPTPCNVARTYLTTEEVLAAVQETTLNAGEFDVSEKPTSTKPPPRLEQLALTRGMEEAKEIISLEDQLKCLTAEKEKLDSKLGRIPTRSSSRSNHISMAEEDDLEKRYDILTKELGSVRMALKKHKAL